MKYYQHDTSSFDDEKISELFLAFGYEGLGLFYTVLEKIAKQEKPVKTSVLKHQLKVGKKLEKCWSFMESLELIYSNNGETFNENILKYSGKYQIEKESTKERVAKWRERQAVNENVTCYKDVSNGPKVNKIKEIEGNIEEEEEIIEPVMFAIPEEVPLDIKNLIKIYVAGEKILSVDDFAHQNWPTLCEVLKMKLGKEIFIKKVAAFEERNADRKYIDERSIREHFSNYMNKFIPEDQIGQVKNNSHDKNTTTPSSFSNGNRETLKSGRDALDAEADRVLRAG